ncbi:hypothetical protein AAMO2058_000612700 [Amorphochlora amoebiformis]
MMWSVGHVVILVAMGGCWGDGYFAWEGPDTREHRPPRKPKPKPRGRRSDRPRVGLGYKGLAYDERPVVEPKPKKAKPSYPVRLKYSLKGHRGSIYAVEFDWEGDYLLSAGEDRQIILWNAKDGDMVKTYPINHSGDILCLLIAHDRKYFLSAASDGKIFMWNTVKGTVTRALMIPRFAKPNSLSWNEDESILACGTEDGQIHIWDLKSRNSKPIQSLRQASGAISSVVVDQPVIIAGSADGSARMYDVRTGKLVTRNFGGPAIGSIRVSKDKRLFLVSCLDNTIRVIDRETGDQLMSYKGHENCKYRIPSLFSNDGSLIVSGSEVQIP